MLENVLFFLSLSSRPRAAMMVSFWSHKLWGCEFVHSGPLDSQIEDPKVVKLVFRESIQWLELGYHWKQNNFLCLFSHIMTWLYIEIQNKWINQTDVFKLTILSKPKHRTSCFMFQNLQEVFKNWTVYCTWLFSKIRHYWALTFLIFNHLIIHYNHYFFNNLIIL